MFSYILHVYTLESLMATAKVFKSGNSQAVRLPKQFRFKTKEVEISRRGDEIILRETRGSLVQAFDLLAALPEDLNLAGRGKDKPQKRKGL
jgi:antitoxin VapB